MLPRSLAVLSLCVASPALGKVVWRGDFETGDLSQWTKAQSVAPDRLQVVRSPVAEGRYALKATVKQGDDPINASGNRNELVHLSYEPEGSEYFYRWSTMFAPSYPSAKTWQLFVQWHHSGSSGSPPVELVVHGEQMQLKVDGARRVLWTAPLERGRWHDFVMHVKWSSNPRVGFIELWHDGRLELPRTYVATQFEGQRNYLKMGLYRNASIAADGVVFHDGMVQATALADVMAPDGGAVDAPDASTLPDGGPGGDVGADEPDAGTDEPGVAPPAGGCSAAPATFGLSALLMAAGWRPGRTRLEPMPRRFRR